MRQWRADPGRSPGLKGAHGVALAPSHRTRLRGPQGNDSSVDMFDLKAYQAQGRIPAAEDADAII